MLLRVPGDHSPASARRGRKKASVLIFPRAIALKRVAKGSDACLRPAKMFRRCAPEQLAAAARSAIVIPFRSSHRSIACESAMAASISMGNTTAQGELFPPEISRLIKAFLNYGMAKAPKAAPRDLHLGPWLALFGATETQAGEAAGCGQSYIANLINGRKKNPSALILLRISEWLGVTVNDLYQPPPTRSEIAPMAKLSPKARDSILDRQRRKA